MKTTLILVAIIFLTGCDPVYHLYVSNESNIEKEVKVSVTGISLSTVDSVKFFSSKEKPKWKNYQNYKNAQKVDKDLTNGTYVFKIKTGETTLLQPLTFITPINYIVIDADTTFLRCKDKKKRFSKIGMFNFIKKIE